MDLRPELLPPVVPEERVRDLSEKIDRIEELLDDDRAAATAAIAAFNEETGHDYEPVDFLCSYGSRDVEDLALEATRPAWPRVHGVTRVELTEVVRRIMAGTESGGLSYRPIAL
ncbi:hypothetical protein ABT124_09370 [Streptomyces sp. NPDC001982]|uniref:hypothetical protein n=1 Tax=unclassified Streptomyces TaxID=2593676 RepID=UPI00332BBA0D